MLLILDMLPKSHTHTGAQKGGQSQSRRCSEVLKKSQAEDDRHGEDEESERLERAHLPEVHSGCSHSLLCPGSIED